MKNFDELIKKVRKYNQDHPTTARQGLRLDDIEQGQLHRCKNSEEHPEFFYLILDTDGDNCKIIPGSLDGIMAGPDDIVLPKSVLGDFIFLSLDLVAKLPKDSIGNGFAVLDDKTFERIRVSLNTFETGNKGDIPSFAFSLPYAGKYDSRIAYHADLKSVLDSAMNRGTVFFIDFTAESTALAAAKDESFDMELAIRGTAQCLLITFDPGNQQMVIHAIEADGEMTKALDGWSVYDERNILLGEIKNGFLDISGKNSGKTGLVLRSPDGGYYHLEQKK